MGARRRRQLAAAMVAVAATFVLALVAFTGRPVVEQPIGREVAGVAETRALLAGVPQHGLALGDPDAPVTIMAYVDLQCPWCRIHQLDVQPAVIDRLVRTGRARLVARPVALPMMGEDSVAGRAVLLRMARAGRAWPFLNLVFWNQGDEGTGYVTDAYLARLAAAAGAPEVSTARAVDAADAAEAAAIDDAFAAQQRTAEAAGETFGTPWVAVGRTGAPESGYAAVPLADGDHVEQIAEAVRRAGG